MPCRVKDGYGLKLEKVEPLFSRISVVKKI